MVRLTRWGKKSGDFPTFGLVGTERKGRDGVLSTMKPVSEAVVEILDQKRTGRTMRMYSAEQRAKGIETFARFGCSAADTMAELGYPSRVPLCNWWKEYQISGDGFWKRERRRPKYSDEEKRGTVDHYLEYGKA